MQIEAEFFSKLNYLQEALEKQKVAYNLLQQLLGENDTKTADAKKVMTQYQRNIVEYNVQVGRAQQNAREELLQKFAKQVEDIKIAKDVKVDGKSNKKK